MKRILSIFFLGIFLFNLAGYYLCFQWQRTGIRHAMEELVRAVDNKPETVLAFHPDALHGKDIVWYSDDEFSWKGNMYDLAYQKVEHGIVYLYCFQDEKEDQLLASLNAHVQKEIPAESGSSKTLVKSFIKDYFFEDKKLVSPALTGALLFYPVLTENGESIFPNVLKQPPRLA